MMCSTQLASQTHSWVLGYYSPRFIYAETEEGLLFTLFHFLLWCISEEIPHYISHFLTL